MLSTGVDLVEIARVAHLLERYETRFLERIYTPNERLYSREHPAELAARLAAKEAVSKALGVGIRHISPAGIGWREAEVLNDPLGKPHLVLHGHAKTLAQTQRLTEWSVSLSHDGGFAIAFVVALGDLK